VVPEPSPPFPDPATVQVVIEAIVTGPGAQVPAALHPFVGSQVVPEPNPPLPDPDTVQAVPVEAMPGVQAPAPLQ